MRTRGKAAALWTALVASLPLWAMAVVAAQDRPNADVYTHPNAPLGLDYFKGSDVVIFHDADAGVIYRSPDAGVSWSEVTEVPEGDAVLLVLHEFDEKRAYILTADAEHWITADRGETWRSFSARVFDPIFQDGILRFHAGDPDRVIFHGLECEGRFCSQHTVYTTDGFETVDTLRQNTDGCWWAKSSLLFTTGDDALDRDRTLCIMRDVRTGKKEHQRLVVSDDFFHKAGGDMQQYEPNLDTDRPVQGVINLAVVKNYLLAAIISETTDEMGLFVTDDTIKWHRAVFPTDVDHPIRHEAYTVLESTEYSIQIDVMFSFPLNPMGMLYTSNSNGTYFTRNVEYTNRNPDGRVDFEKISGIQGIFLVNSVANGEHVEDDPAQYKKVISHITYDDGRTLDPIYADGKRIHLHSFTELDNAGKVFSSPAPGLVLGNGNTGDQLKPYDDANLYVSDDAGLTWKQALKGAHKYEFGDQGSILVAVRDSFNPDVAEYSYSLNHGDDWETFKLPERLKIKPLLLTTAQQSAGLKFLIIGRTKDGEYKLVALDFAGLRQRTCGDADMEDWRARVGDDGSHVCVMGHKQTYARRKKSADCFLKKPFTKPVPRSEPCECADVDFECDYNFVRDEDRNCKPAAALEAPEGACANPHDTFRGSSGWRKIPGNQCKGGQDKEAKVDRSCKDAAGKGPGGPASGKPENAENVLASGYDNIQKFYLERDDWSQTHDETVVARAYRHTPFGGATPDSTIWRTKDHGKTWEQILEDEQIFDIVPHQYSKDTIFFTVRNSRRVIYTIDRGEHFHEFEAPLEPDDRPLHFHPDRRDWLIWLGRKYEKVGDNVIREASVSTSRGDKWEPLLPGFVDKCKFTGQSSFAFRPAKQVMCLARAADTDGKDLVGSDDFFVENEQTLARDVKNFAAMNEFIVVAAEDDDGLGLKALTSIDGVEFREAKFPLNSIVSHENAYTVLDSSSHAIRLFVATETTEDRRFGNIVKSNSNGTSYVRIAEAVNCNNAYYVDFEKVAGLEGVLLINVVVNKEQTGEPKLLRTRISHNDGAEWGYLAPPDADVRNAAYGCRSSKGDENCALHIHHYTERQDKSKTFSAASAVGVMFAVGNVGSALGPLEDADTFLTTDGGVTWKNVAKGPWTWQFGDQGSLLLLVQRHTSKSTAKTKTLLYSMDEGDTWEEHVFSDREVQVIDVTSQRSGSSRNFLLWVQDGDDVSAINVDFGGNYERACVNPRIDDKDYYLWSPKHPLQDNDCFFGHVSKYYRKQKGNKCYNDQTLDHLYQGENCECTRRDYECEYNYELDNSGQCHLVEGHQPLSAKEWCARNPNASAWYEEARYRKLPLSTCVGGREFDKVSTPHSCPGHEEEFEREHGTSGVGVFLAVVLPILAASGAGWWVWRNWSGKFGQIRLGENAVGDEPLYIKYPVIAVSAIFAAAVAVPLIATSIWRTATSMYERVGGGSAGAGWRGAGGSGRFTTRDSFARSRSDYAVVDEDEGELLGEDSDDEV